MTTTHHKPSLVWVGVIPDIFGSGLIVVAKTKASASAALRKEYADRKGVATFAEAFEYWGGYFDRIELGKAYSDGFRS